MGAISRHLAAITIAASFPLAAVAEDVQPRAVLPAQNVNSVYGVAVAAPKGKSATRQSVEVAMCSRGLETEGNYLTVARCDTPFSFAAGKGAVVVEGPSERIAAIVRTTRNVAVPRGYREAWTDGRLNLYRGVGTSEGAAQMQEVWEMQTPFQLRDR